MTADRAALLPSLDFRREGLAPVQAALDTGDLTAAGAAYIAHFRAKRLESPLLTDWATRPCNAAYDTTAADNLLAGHFWDGYSVYEVPPAGLDWHNSPLSCVTRFPIFGTLREAIHHTRNPGYVRFVVQHILDYIAAYPMAEFAGKSMRDGWIDHVHVAKPWYWCMVPNRLPELAQTLALIRAFPEVHDEELLAILHRLYQETAYLCTDIQSWVDARHNGGCAMIQALAMACVILEDFAATRAWLAYAARLAVQYIEQAFYPDGVCIELTTAYSASVAEEIQNVVYALRDEVPIQANRERLRAMLTSLVALSDPTGWLPSFGDLYATTLPEYIHQRLALWLDLPWVEARARGVHAPEPPFTAWPLPRQEAWCGYYTMRSDWGRLANYLAIDGGPWGTTHQHGDKLSFVITAQGAKFIIDPSSTRYASNAPGAFIGGQPSGFLHNTITIDGVDEFRSPATTAEVKAPLTNRWEHGAGYSLFVGDYSFAPVRRVCWERRVLFVDGSYWLLQDVLTGEEAGAAVEQNFQFEADIEIAFDGNTTVATAPNGARLLLLPLGGALQPRLTLGDRAPHTTYWPAGSPTEVLRSEDGHDQKHGRGWTGRGGDRLLPAPAVTYVGTMPLPALITLALVPLAPGATRAGVPAIGTTSLDAETVWCLPVRGGCLRVRTGPGRCEVERVGPGQ